MEVLIVGASGYLGKRAYLYFKNKYDKVIGTYHTNKIDNSMISFDITKDDIENIKFGGTDKCAIICAAEAKYDACKIRNTESFRLNVTSTIEVIKKLKALGYYIIFCSTEAVYEGTKGNYKETDEANPVNEYGRMKLQVEQYITKHYPDMCVFRLSKMIGDIDSKRDTLCEWKKMASSKEDIYCIKGNYFSPVDVEDVVKCIEIACLKKVGGIYNICGNKIYSRAELCRDFLRAVELNTNVYEKEVGEFGFCAARPLNVGMSNKKAVHTLEFIFNDMKKIFERYRDI